MALIGRLVAPVIKLLDWLVRNYSREGWLHLGRDDKMALMRVDQRSVEYFWVTRLLSRSDKTLLEVGCSGSWFGIFLSRLGYEVWGIDLIDEGRTAQNFKFVLEDARVGEKLPDNYFDVVFSVSVFEHIGLRPHKKVTIVEDEEGDIKAAQAMARKVKPGGKFIMTSPYGSGRIWEDQFARTYTRERLQRLIAASGLEFVEADYFQYNQDDVSRALVLADPDEMDRTGNYGSYGYGLVCLHLRKPPAAG
jgi:SAM-dependent methyltransferase